MDAMDSLVDKDPDAEIIYVDDEYYTTLAGYGTELVYGIAISHKRRSIFVVFRGSAGVQDWQNFQCGMVDFNLPGYVDVGTVSQCKSGRYGKVHAGFYDYLFAKSKVREDGDSTATAENIVRKVSELLKNDCQNFDIYVTGHSLGGALSTMMAFRLAQDEGISQKITNVSIASPFVGDQEFRNQFQDLEKKRKLLHLRVANDEDCISLTPMATTIVTPLGANYKHVGVHLKLYDKTFLNPYFRLFFPKENDLFNEVRNAFHANLVSGLSLRPVSKHMCPEYRKRLDDAMNELKEISLESLYSDDTFTGFSVENGVVEAANTSQT